MAGSNTVNIKALQFNFNLFSTNNVYFLVTIFLFADRNLYYISTFGYYLMSVLHYVKAELFIQFN